VFDAPRDRDYCAGAGVIRHEGEGSGTQQGNCAVELCTSIRVSGSPANDNCVGPKSCGLNLRDLLMVRMLGTVGGGSGSPSWASDVGLGAASSIRGSVVGTVSVLLLWGGTREADVRAWGACGTGGLRFCGSTSVGGGGLRGAEGDVAVRPVHVVERAATDFWCEAVVELGVIPTSTMPGAEYPPPPP
jgi:hypothetical protein